MTSKSQDESIPAASSFKPADMQLISTLLEECLQRMNILASVMQMRLMSVDDDHNIHTSDSIDSTESSQKRHSCNGWLKEHDKDETLNMVLSVARYIHKELGHVVKSLQLQEQSPWTMTREIITRQENMENLTQAATKRIQRISELRKFIVDLKRTIRTERENSDQLITNLQNEWHEVSCRMTANVATLRRQAAARHESQRRQIDSQLASLLQQLNEHTQDTHKLAHNHETGVHHINTQIQTLEAMTQSRTKKYNQDIQNIEQQIQHYKLRLQESAQHLAEAHANHDRYESVLEGERVCQLRRQGMLQQSVMRARAVVAIQRWWRHQRQLQQLQPMKSTHKRQKTSIYGAKMRASKSNSTQKTHRRSPRTLDW